ncbi:MAG: integration host factor subunit beta [Terriglobus roseus]|nr:integration host factor subunit beta [Terriglobus roseus]
MIRSELVARIAKQNPHLYARDVEQVVSAILDRMIAALADGDRVELRGLGAFSTRETRARVSRNPRSGASEDERPLQAVQDDARATQPREDRARGRGGTAARLR